MTRRGKRVSGKSTSGSLTAVVRTCGGQCGSCSRACTVKDIGRRLRDRLAGYYKHACSGWRKDEEKHGLAMRWLSSQLPHDVRLTDRAAVRSSEGKKSYLGFDAVLKGRGASVKIEWRWKKPAGSNESQWVVSTSSGSEDTLTTAQMSLFALMG